MSKTNEHVVIIGGTSGIGLAAARRLAADGFKVTVAGRSPERLAAARARPSPTRPRSCRLTERTRRRCANFLPRLGAFDHLGAGARQRARLRPFAALDLNEVRRGFEEKVLPHLSCAQAALPTIRKDGSITFIAAVSAQMAAPGTVGLAAANGALSVVAPILAAELRPLRVNAVSPGVVDTAWWDFMDEEQRKRRLRRFRPPHAGWPRRRARRHRPRDRLPDRRRLHDRPRAGMRRRPAAGGLTPEPFDDALQPASSPARLCAAPTARVISAARPSGARSTVERRGGGAAGRGDVLAQLAGADAGLAVQQLARALDRRARELHRQIGGQAEFFARLRHRLDEREHIGRAGAGERRHRVDQRLVGEPFVSARPRSSGFRSWRAGARSSQASPRPPKRRARRRRACSTSPARRRRALGRRALRSAMRLPARIETTSVPRVGERRKVRRGGLEHLRLDGEEQRLGRLQRGERGIEGNTVLRRSARRSPATASARGSSTRPGSSPAASQPRSIASPILPAPTRMRDCGQSDMGSLAVLSGRMEAHANSLTATASRA